MTIGLEFIEFDCDFRHIRTQHEASFTIPSQNL